MRAGRRLCRLVVSPLQLESYNTNNLSSVGRFAPQCRFAPPLPLLTSLIAAFKPGGNRRLLKHESFSKTGHDTTFPYSSSPYDESREYWYKVKKMEDAKILAGSFRGSKQKLNSNKISYLPEVVKLLFKEIKDDWEEVRGGREGGGGETKRSDSTG